MTRGSHAFCAGEVAEFKQELNALDRGKRKDAVKKVIAGNPPDWTAPL